MKFILVFLFAATLFAQSPAFQDSVILFNGKTYPCYVSKLDVDDVTITYQNDITIDAALKTISTLQVSTLGIVFTHNEGYTRPLKELQKRLQERNSLVNKTETIVKTGRRPLPGDEYSANLVWTFGITWFPAVNSPGTYYYYPDYIPESIGLMVFKTPRMDGYLAYKIADNIAVTATLGISASTNDSREVSRTTNTSNPNVVVIESEVQSSITNLDLVIGSQFAFFKPANGKIELDAFFALGKQLSFVDTKNPPTSLSGVPESEIANYIRDINSPWHLDFGLRLQYYFNENLSLSPVMNFRYFWTKAQYTSETIASGYKRTADITRKYSGMSTEFGIGLNFHF